MPKNFLFAALAIGFFLLPSMGHALPEKDFYSQINEMRLAPKADQQAIIAFAQKAIQETPDASPKMRAMAAAVMGEAYGKQGEADKGIALCRDSLNIQETFFAHVQLSNLLLGKKDYHAAIEALTKAMAVSDDPALREKLEKQIAHIQNTYLTISAKALYAAFHENEVAAEDRYKGKLLFVEGKISAITTDVLGNPVVSLDAGDYGFGQVHCVFPKEARSIIGKLPKGRNIRIPGTCDGMVMGVVFLKDCKVE